MDPLYLDILATVMVIMKALLMVLSVIFIIFGMDELFIDVASIVLHIRKKLIMRTHPRLSDTQLFEKEEQYIALMIPCWDESAVIRNMVENAIKVLNYTKYVIFIGTYPNDSATQREVSLLRETYSHVERIVCPKDGPTNKADCLNWIYEGIKLYEKDNGIQFQIIIMDDSEDVLHPWAFRLFNYLIPRMDMVQLPVFPMEPPHWYDFTSGHYMDEFAECHSRDLIVRESLTGVVPSAGVATGFSRSILEKLAALNRGQVFVLGSMTEDYDMGIRLHEIGSRSVFVRNVPVLRLRGKETESESMLRLRRNFIANRGYFPATFSTAVRQKSRWIIGIALQGWARLGWKGSLVHKYMLSRDRKSLLTNCANMLANFFVPLFLALWLYPTIFPDAYRFPPLVEPGSWLDWMLRCNFFIFVWRICLRSYYVSDVYGPLQGLLSVPRLFWANVINFFAAMRALRIYGKYLITGKAIVWDKTEHAFPTESALRAYRRRLGDMLMDRRLITVVQLEAAVAEQQQTGSRLGEILCERGLISPEDLQVLLDAQNGMGSATQGRQRLGDMLKNRRLVTALQLEEALQRQKESGQRLGDVLLQMQLVTEAQLTQILGIQGGDAAERIAQSTTHRLGDIFLDQQIITHIQLDEAVTRQRQNGKKLGETLQDMGLLSEENLRKALQMQHHSTR